MALDPKPISGLNPLALPLAGDEMAAFEKPGTPNTSGRATVDNIVDRARRAAGYQEVNTDADFTLTIGTSPRETRHTGTLTADRTVTLAAGASPYAGAVFRVTRTGGGDFNLNVGGLVNLKQNEEVEVIYDGTSWYVAAYGSTKLVTSREELLAPRTYYVNSTTGNNNNDGLSSGTAFATIQKAMDVIASDIDLGAHNVTVSIADGTYTSGLILKSYRATSGFVTFQGNLATPANVLISPASGAVITNAEGASGYFELYGVKLEVATADRLLYITGPKMDVSYGSIDFGESNGGGHIEASHKARITAKGDFTVSGGAAVGIWANRNALIFISSRTITYLNSPVFSARNFNASEQGWLDAYGMTFVNGGTVTGKRYDVAGVAGIFTNFAGANYIPGDVAGTVDFGGVYY